MHASVLVQALGHSSTCCEQRVDVLLLSWHTRGKCMGDATGVVGSVVCFYARADLPRGFACESIYVNALSGAQVRDCRVAFEAA